MYGRSQLPSRGAPVLERNTADLEEWKTSKKQPHSLAAGESVDAEAVCSISLIWSSIAAVWRRIVLGQQRQRAHSQNLTTALHGRRGAPL